MSENQNDHHLGLLSIVTPSSDGSVPLITNDYTSYTYAEEDYDIGIPKSESSTFAYHYATFFLKKQNDKEIELTYNCPYDSRFTFESLEKLQEVPPCTPCQYDPNNLLIESSKFISIGGQNPECLNCA